jgi:hypothetical protein
VSAESIYVQGEFIFGNFNWIYVDVSGYRRLAYDNKENKFVFLENYI